MITQNGAGGRKHHQLKKQRSGCECDSTGKNQHGSGNNNNNAFEEENEEEKMMKVNFHNRELRMPTTSSVPSLNSNNNNDDGIDINSHDSRRKAS